MTHWFALEDEHMTIALDRTESSPEPIYDPLTNHTVRLSDLAFTRLAEEISSGRRGPGETLRDQSIAREFGVSRMPVREAIMRLERVQLVEVAASRHTRVTAFDAARVAETLEFAGFLYSMTTSLTALRATEESIEHGVRLLDDAIGAPEDEATLAALRAFFRLTLDHAGNRVVESLEDFTHLVQHAESARTPSENAARVRPHLADLRDAFAARESAAAAPAIHAMHRID